MTFQTITEMANHAESEMTGGGYYDWYRTTADDEIAGRGEDVNPAELAAIIEIESRGHVAIRRVGPVPSGEILEFSSVETADRAKVDFWADIALTSGASVVSQ